MLPLQKRRSTSIRRTLVCGAEGSTTSLSDVFDVLCALGTDARPDIDPRRALGCPGPPSDVPRGA